MATENLTVVHIPAKTASFDMKNRVLRCPLWQDMSGDMYDLFMGHEVGHALNTPAKGWHDAVEPRGKKFKSFLNVIEDARIEKLIQRKYPGLRRSFHLGYKALIERGFFGGVEKLPNTDVLNLIDRINIHFKLSPTVLANFTAEEQVFVDRTAHAETWQEVEQIAIDVWEYVKKNEANKPHNQTALDDLIEEILEKMKEQRQDDSGGESPQESQDNSGEESTPSEKKDGKDAKPSKEKSEKKSDKKDGKKGEKSDAEDGEEGDSGKGDGEDGEDEDSDSDGSGGDSDGDDSDNSDKDSGGDGSDDSSENEESDKSSKAGKGAGGSGNANEEEPSSVTDDAFRDAEESLVDTKAKAVVQYFAPEVYLENIIVPNSEVLKSFEEGAQRHMTSFPNLKLVYSAVAPKLAALFHKRNAKYISLLVKEFEMRKNATQYSRQLTSKTGELDTRRLHNYKFSSDIFRKVTAVEKGKDHGMIMFVDMSSSMMSNMGETIEQTLVLVTFCKKVGIPFEVYGFCNSPQVSYPTLTTYKSNNKKFDAPDADKKNFSVMNNGGAFHLKTLISSGLNSTEFKRSFNMLVTYGTGMSHHSDRDAATNAVIGEYRIYGDACNFHLSSTPYIETLLASKTIIKNFKNRTHIDIVNVIYLTDGAGDPAMLCTSWAPDVSFTKHTRVLVDKATGESAIIGGENSFADEQEALTVLTRKITGCRHIGIYVGETRSLDRVVCASVPKEKFADAITQMHDEGFLRIEARGYDSYFLLPMTGGGNRDKFVTDAKGTNNLTRAFIEHQRTKSNKRFICAAFSKEIAVRI